MKALTQKELGPCTDWFKGNPEHYGVYEIQHPYKMEHAFRTGRVYCHFGPNGWGSYESSPGEAYTYRMYTNCRKGLTWRGLVTKVGP